MTTTTAKTKSTHRTLTEPANDNNLLDDLDSLVSDAARGDARAVGAIAIAFGPTLLSEARDALGPAYAQEDADVVNDLCVSLMEGALLFPRTPHVALAWLKHAVRGLAADRVRHATGPADRR